MSVLFQSVASSSPRCQKPTLKPFVRASATLAPSDVEFWYQTSWLTPPLVYEKCGDSVVGSITGVAFTSSISARMLEYSIAVAGLLAPPPFGQSMPYIPSPRMNFDLSGIVSM